MAINSSLDRHGGLIARRRGNLPVWLNNSSLCDFDGKASCGLRLKRKDGYNSLTRDSCCVSWARSCNFNRTVCLILAVNQGNDLLSLRKEIAVRNVEKP